MIPICPRCQRPIPDGDFHVAKDLAYCRACQESFSFADLMEEAELEVGLDVRHPPEGAWYRSEGADTVAGVSLRSLSRAGGALAIALFWNGIVSVFVCIALSGTLHLLGVPLPVWFPAPTSEKGAPGLGMLCFLWLFLTPFIVVGLTMIWGVLAHLVGKVEVRVGKTEGTIFTGLGPLGWKRRFDPRQVESVKLVNEQSRKGQSQTCIQMALWSGKNIKIGGLLWGERQKFLAAVLGRMVRRRETLSGLR